MSNGDEFTRKSHIHRIYKDDDPDSGQWIDIERIDELFLVSKRQFPWREKRWKFDWDSFDPGGDNITRKKIKQNPDDDDSTAIEVPVRDMVFVTEGREQQFQGYRHFFINDDSNTTRETYSRRVYHYEISDAQLDDDKNPPRDPQAYMNALGTKDEDQYVEVEILDKYWTNEHETRDALGNVIAGISGIWQEKKWQVASDDPLMTDPAGDTSHDGDIINPDAGPQVDPPWRLDPLQNIVNVKWGGGSIAVAGNRRTGFGGEHDYIYRCKMTTGTKDPNWNEVSTWTPTPEPEDRNGFDMGVGCGIYASIGADDAGKGGTPTFVFGGNYGGNAEQPARIQISNDGKTWTNVYDGPGEGTIYGVCWDEDQKAFYAAMTDDSEIHTPSVNSYDVLLRSSDGNGWSEVYRAQTGGVDFTLPPDYRNPIVDHGGTKVQDSDGVNVTNAFWGYNKGTKTLIYPDPPYNYWSGSGGGTQLKIKREKTDSDGNQTTETETKGLDMDGIFCVTFADGIWHACGQNNETSPGQGGIGRIATSKDDGKTWEITYVGTAGNPIASIASGPARDFSSE